MKSWEYIRLFGIGGDQPSDQDIQILSNVISSVQDNTKNNVPAGYTYFGQFISHDLTFLGHGTREPAAIPVDLSSLSLRRNPTLNLDSIYGGGLDDSVIPFDQSNGKFILGVDNKGLSNDLPREDSGRARIGDPRNDENLLIAQIQLLFMKLHNKLVELHQARGERNPRILNTIARQEVVTIFHHLVLHDFANRILPTGSTDRTGKQTESVYDVVIKEGSGKLLPRNNGQLKLALELAGAALRFGHSMVDTQYDLNYRFGASGEKVRLLLNDLFHATGTSIDRENPLSNEFRIDWRFFFRFYNYRGQESIHPNLARKIDLSVNPYMLQIPGNNAAPDSCPTPNSVNIVERNIQRGRELGLQSGQEICRQLLQRDSEVAGRIGLHPLSEQIPFFRELKAAGAGTMIENTPLWVYVLLEADTQQNSRLGSLGGWLVADGLLAAVEATDRSLTTDRSVDDLVFGESEALQEYRSGNGSLDLADIAAFVQPDLVS